MISQCDTMLTRACGLDRSRHHLKPQSSCGTNDRARDRLQLEMLEVLISCLDFCNFIHVFEADGSKYFVSRTCRTLFQTGNLPEEVGGWRRFCDKCERPVWLDMNHGRNRNTRFDVGCPGIELFAKVH